LKNSRKTAQTESSLEAVSQRRKSEGFDRVVHNLRGTFVTQLAIYAQDSLIEPEDDGCGDADG